jgi:hypothetical protein
VASLRAEIDDQEHLTVFSRGPKSNWNRNDELLPAICTAAAFTGSNATMQAVRSLGVTATAFDAYMGSLVSAICLAQDHLNCHPTHKITILSPNPAAIQAITNLRRHAGQFFAREFCNMRTQILSLFRHTMLQLEWCPPKSTLPGLKRSSELAQADAANPFPPNHREPYTLAFQSTS